MIRFVVYDCYFGQILTVDALWRNLITYTNACRLTFIMATVLVLFEYFKIMLKLHRCDWSKDFSLDAVGNAGDLVCEETKTSREYEVSIHDHRNSIYIL